MRHSMIVLAGLALSAACAAQTALVESDGPFTPAEAGRVAVSLRAPGWMPVPAGVGVRLMGGDLLRLGSRFEVVPVSDGSALESGTYWTVGGASLLFDDDPLVELMPAGAVVFVGNVTPSAAVGPNTCTVTCSAGNSYACCVWGSSNRPRCFCVQVSAPSQTCDSGGPGSTECSLTQTSYEQVVPVVE